MLFSLHDLFRRAGRFGIFDVFVNVDVGLTLTVYRIERESSVRLSNLK